MGSGGMLYATSLRMINRHETNCGKANYHHTCDCGVEAGDPHWYKKKLEVIGALERGYEECKHHTSFTRRLLPYFSKHVHALGGNYTMGVYPAANYTPNKVEVWGGGLRYQEGVDITLYTMEKDKKWTELFEVQIARARQSVENGIASIAREDSLEKKLDLLAKKVQALKDEASILVTESVSSDLTRTYPELFR